MVKPPPSSKLSRGTVVGKALLKIGAAHGKGLVKRTLGSRSESNAHAEQTHEQIADIIFDALGELKGVSVKIAQQVALGMPFLSPVYLERIARSFNSIPPLNKALVRKIVKQELGRYPNELFEKFESDAFAAASLGQVHKALYKGDEVAVKMQYPGIRQSIGSDMSLIHFAIKRFAKGQNVDHIVSEIEGRLYEEIDYALEAENCTFFGSHRHNDAIVIPTVYGELSTEKILVTSLLRGLSFEEYLATDPAQEEKDAYAQLLFDSFFYTLYKHRRIHADPNPGNFLFMEGGKLGLIDFGCVKQVEDAFLEKYNRLHIDLVENRHDGVVIPQYIDLNMIARSDEASMEQFYTEVIKPLDTLYKEPLIGESYDFGTNSDFSKRGFEMIFKVQQKQFHSVHRLNEQFLFLNRTLLGYYAIFEKMGARIETGYVKGLMRDFKGGKDGK